MNAIVIKREAKGYTVQCFKGETIHKQMYWRSHTKIIDMLKQSGAVRPKRNRTKHHFVVWPENPGEQFKIEVHEPVAWFWE